VLHKGLPLPQYQRFRVVLGKLDLRPKRICCQSDSSNITETISFIGVRVMMLDATFNNISVISLRSVLLVEEIGVHGEKPL
jgi:hypothetical protein